MPTTKCPGSTCRERKEQLVLLVEFFTLCLHNIFHITEPKITIYTQAVTPIPGQDMWSQMHRWALCLIHMCSGSYSREKEETTGSLSRIILLAVLPQIKHHIYLQMSLVL